MNLSKRLLIIFLAVCAVVILCVLFILHGNRKNIPADSQQVTFPAASSVNGSSNPAGDMMVLQTNTGNAIQVHNFKNSPNVIKDPNVEGQYDLVGGAYPDPGIPYAIFYQTRDDYFGITLLSEPLSERRTAAENQLAQTLGIAKQDLCRLHYVVAPGPGVNDTYSGENLGFSFCPGAIPLPD